MKKQVLDLTQTNITGSIDIDVLQKRFDLMDECLKRKFEGYNYPKRMIKQDELIRIYHSGDIMKPSDFMFK